MEVFGRTRLLYKLMSICYPAEGTRASVRYLYLFFTSLYFVVHAVGLWVAIGYGLDCGLEDIEGSLNAISQVAGCINAAYTTFGGVIYRRDFTRTLDRYVELHKKGEVWLRLLPAILRRNL